jgi:hypothetical protein
MVFMSSLMKRQSDRVPDLTGVGGKVCFDGSPRLRYSQPERPSDPLKRNLLPATAHFHHDHTFASRRPA